MFSEVWKIVSGVLGVSAVAFLLLWQFKVSAYDKLQSDYNKAMADNKLIEVQKDSLVNAIVLKNKELEEFKLNEKKNLEDYSASLEKNNRELRDRSAYARTLSGDAGCKYIRGVINEILAP